MRRDSTLGRLSQHFPLSIRGISHSCYSCVNRYVCRIARCIFTASWQGRNIPWQSDTLVEILQDRLDAFVVNFRTQLDVWWRHRDAQSIPTDGITDLENRVGVHSGLLEAAGIEEFLLGTLGSNLRFGNLRMTTTWFQLGKAFESPMIQSKMDNGVTNHAPFPW